MIVVRSPPQPARRPAAADRRLGLGPAPAWLRSSTTRQDGVVAAIDLPPTILKRLGLRVPEDMKGEPIETVPRPAARAT